MAVRCRVCGKTCGIRSGGNCRMATSARPAGSSGSYGLLNDDPRLAAMPLCRSQHRRRRGEKKWARPCDGRATGCLSTRRPGVHNSAPACERPACVDSRAGPSHANNTSGCRAAARAPAGVQSIEVGLPESPSAAREHQLGIYRWSDLPTALGTSARGQLTCRSHHRSAGSRPARSAPLPSPALGLIVH